MKLKEVSTGRRAYCFCACQADKLNFVLYTFSFANASKITCHYNEKGGKNLIASNHRDLTCGFLCAETEAE
jgi:hypothetical protein